MWCEVVLYFANSRYKYYLQRYTYVIDIIVKRKKKWFIFNSQWCSTEWECRVRENHLLFYILNPVTKKYFKSKLKVVDMTDISSAYMMYVTNIPLMFWSVSTAWAPGWCDVSDICLLFVLLPLQIIESYTTLIKHPSTALIISTAKNGHDTESNEQ